MRTNKGFSLLDTVTALFVSSLLFAIFTSSLPNYNRLLQKIQSTLSFEEQMIIFFLQLEEDFFSATLDQNSKDAIANSLSFQRWEWDYSSNSFKQKTSSYQFQSSTKQIRRKINNERYYTSFLQAVGSFEYQVLEQSNAFCLQISIQSIFSTHPKKQIFCRHF